MKVNKINPAWLDIYQSFLGSEMTEAELYGCFYGSYNRSQISFANQAWKSHLYKPADNKDIVKINGFTFNSSNMKNSEKSLINIGMRSERALNHNCSILDDAEMIGLLMLIHLMWFTVMSLLMIWLWSVTLLHGAGGLS
jgi:hypothetical protein